MTQNIASILARLREHLPPVLSIPAFDDHPALPASKTIRNLRAARAIPEGIFLRDGRRVLVDTARFLDWWGPRLSDDSHGCAA